MSLRVTIIALLALLAGCADKGLQIDREHVSKSQDSRIQYVIIHYTSENLPRSLEILTHGEVSAHYLIGDQPATIYQLVDENRRAWHAGQSEWQGRTWLNSTSIGIELVNQGYRETPSGKIWYPYPDAQIDALIALLKDITRRQGITPEHILGHSDIAPQRKVDPGPLFPWKKLADAGLIPWPKPGEIARRLGELDGQLPSAGWFQQQLARHGYAVPLNGVLDEKTRNVIAAFQMRFRPQRFDGEPDLETAALLLAVPTS
ncbi:N-acetylmuramoyl-L-alanine amidase [Pseudomonas sp. ZM23]|uniref:N-acetylmuramoyl-L-alanine amidase n=1 Tax=Pseudomonas triclosanedens TaxID=2961893 RepID=A0ABY6ZXI1_9PSED|nr:N-acetylmuramoyl-L-alanine amidase [Pseudomonas triclosanedens]MCP8462473.1 N-acetylmuramoyl-L-alanine amidase [Pseudomonas triclosanedens]MCP8468111.1 N-acetylmuramoyl-L-alanine amidase [Pseudomonas triclosanedens]MCP8474870.1 N-acetylmuramoyl-L-alanine amidase [Pseudomonas triclosanedens]WAI49667.1 N-acetylmuramoyl-L-alanine amidase [Pseudomonas triclosanedens]